MDNATQTTEVAPDGERILLVGGPFHGCTPIHSGEPRDVWSRRITHVDGNTGLAIHSEVIYGRMPGYVGSVEGCFAWSLTRQYPESLN